MSKFAWVTLTTNDTYSLGALVLAHSLKRVSTAHQLAVLVTSGVSEAMRNRLKEVYNVVQEVNVLDSQDAANLALLQRPELGITFTKLHCWKLVQFEKCVFLDADILVIQNCDELFEREELSAAPDISWPDCFNSGVFVFRPSVDTYGKLVEFALQFGSFDGGDQGLLNQYFSDWAQKDISKRLPFIYNTHAFASYSYLPAFKQFRDRIKILHFAGRFKPWLANFNSESKTVYPPQDFQHISDLIQLWWTIYCGSVHHGLSDQMPTPRIDQNFITSAIYGQMWQNMDTRYEENSHFENRSDQFDSSYDPSNDKANYYDPWEDYYENLEKCEQNQPNWENTTQEETFRHVEVSHNEDSTHNIAHNISNSNTNIEQNNPCLTCSTEMTTNVSETSSHHMPSVQPELRIDENFQNLRCSEYSAKLNMVKSDIHSNSTNKQEIHEFSCGTTEEFVDKQNIVKEHFEEKTNYETTSQEQQVIVESTQVPQPRLDDSVFNSNSENFSAQNNNNSVESEENVRKPEETNNENGVEEAGLAGALSRLTLGAARTPEQEAYEQHMRRQCWESGNIDYTGKDSFDNIWKKITQTLEAGAAKKESETKSDSARFTTSADIQDGKVEFDKATNSTITYKKIPKGYQMVIETPQPNGTLKTQTKTFYDPVPVPADEIEENGSVKKTTRTQKDSKNVSDRTVALSNPNTTMITRKIPNGREEVYTTVNADGTKSIQIKTFYDAQEEEITETTQVEQEVPGETRIITKQKTPTQQKQVVQQEEINKKQVVQQQQTSVQKHEQQQVTQQVKIKHFQETKQFSQTTEISGKSITTKNEESLQAISDQTTEKKKKKKTRGAPPPPIEDKPGQKTTVIEKKIAGGTEYHYTTRLEDGKTVTSVKTVYDEEEVDMTEEEIKKYKKQLKEAEKHKNLTETTSIPTKHGNKQVIPSAENPGEVTTVETKKIKGGTEYHYTTVTADGVVKKSSKTVYDPVPVEGSDEEEEIIEEYEEEVIEPGETITETYQTTKTLSHVEHHEETVQKKKKGKVVKK